MWTIQCVDEQRTRIAAIWNMDVVGVRETNVLHPSPHTHLLSFVFIVCRRSAGREW